MFIVHRRRPRSSTPNGQIAIQKEGFQLETASNSYGGPILFNPGGPGGSGIDIIQGRHGDLLSTIVGPQFDVIGFDPRGIGRSTPRASFFSTAIERELWSAGESFIANTSSEEGVARTWARARLLGDLAARNDDGGCDQTARDMLSIVHAHGREKLLYWGFSYGTSLGAVFASLFPDEIERMILDGVVDSDEYFGNEWPNNLSDASKVLSSFFTTCSLAGPSTCPFWAPIPDAIRANLTKLTESVRTRPVPVLVSPSPSSPSQISEPDQSTATYGLLDYPTLRHTVFQSLYQPYNSFPILAQGLADLATGNGTLLFKHFGARGDPVFCNDNAEIPEELSWAEAYFKRMVQASEWADVWAGFLIACQGWPEFPKTNFRGPFGGNTSHPILFIGNTADPVTPLWGAHKMSKAFNGSAVLTQNSAGHGSISGPSLCTERHVRKYFATGVLPEAGTVCNVTGSPFPDPTEGFKHSVAELCNAQQKTMEIFIDTHNDMTRDDQELLSAATELSKMPLTSHLRLSIIGNFIGSGSCC